MFVLFEERPGGPAPIRAFERPADVELALGGLPAGVYSFALVDLARTVRVDVLGDGVELARAMRVADAVAELDPDGPRRQEQS